MGVSFLGGVRSGRGLVVGSALLGSLLAGCSDNPGPLSFAPEEPVDLALYARFLPSRPEQLPPPRDPRTGDETERLLLEHEARLCQSRIDEARSGEPRAGAPRLEARRQEVLLRGKAEPVLFVEAPHFTGDVSPGLAAQRRHLERTPFQREAVLSILSQFKGFLPELRALLLRDGYFYADDPAAARELSHRVSLEDLFKEPELVLDRGSTRFRLRRDGPVYVHVDGTERGTRARLLLFDRVALPGQELGPAIHLDVRELSRREGFEQLRVDFLGDRELVVELSYGGTWVPALLSRSDAELSVECLLIEPEDAARVGRMRDASFRRRTVVHAIQTAILEQVRAGLPFDEPKTERGQQDGKLRQRWEEAYFGGRDEYSFNGDKYRVFDAGGMPLAPQVCVDFVTETLERASGMHFAKRGQAPQKVLGALDFDELLGGKRRQELALRDFARENPARLALVDYPVADRVSYEKVGAFFSALVRQKDDLRPGDIVIIRGRAAWDRYEEVHTHTFFVYESDPVTGVPTLIAGNSGKPRILTWDDEMLRAPKRSIAHRIRPNMEWLYDHVVHRHPVRGERWAQPLVVTDEKSVE